MRSQRVFGSWTLACEVLLSRGTRACALWQPVGQGARALEWKVELTASLRPVVVVDGPLAMASGLTAYVSGAAVRMPGPACDASGCTVAMPLGGRIEAALASGGALTFAFSEGRSRVTADASGDGFPQAAASLSGPPDATLYGTFSCGTRSLRPRAEARPARAAQ